MDFAGFASRWLRFSPKGGEIGGCGGGWGASSDGRVLLVRENSSGSWDGCAVCDWNSPGEGVSADMADILSGFDASSNCGVSLEREISGNCCDGFVAFTLYSPGEGVSADFAGVVPGLLLRSTRELFAVTDGSKNSATIGRYVVPFLSGKKVLSFTACEFFLRMPERGIFFNFSEGGSF